jgi:hypothetical protein
MINRFKHRALAHLPHWANVLHLPYWRIRVEGRNRALRRRCYRIIEKEKLKLVEQGIPVEHVNAVCRYLVNLRETSANNLQQVLAEPILQMKLPF